MKENLRTTRNMEQGNYSIHKRKMRQLVKNLAADHIWAILKMGSNMGKDFSLTKIKIFIKGFGNKEKSMEKALILFLTKKLRFVGFGMKVILYRENESFQMGLLLKENLNIINQLMSDNGNLAMAI